MEIILAIIIFVIGALMAASHGDFSGVEIIVKVVLYLVFVVGFLYALSSCAAAFD